eukprot:929058-Rhodomonas_salina.1
MKVHNSIVQASTDSLAKHCNHIKVHFEPKVSYFRPCSEPKIAKYQPASDAIIEYEIFFQKFLVVLESRFMQSFRVNEEPAEQQVKTEEET